MRAVTPLPRNGPMTWITHRRLLLVALTFVWACSAAETAPEPSAQPPAFDAQAAARLQAQADAVVEQWHNPGTAVAAIDEHGALWLGASGFWDPVAGIELEPSQVSKAGSVTKTMTAAVILQLVEEQVVTLDDPVSRWWEGLPDGDAISLRDLLRHGSGLPDYVLFVDPVTELQRPWAAGDLVALIADEPRLFAPGADYSYSNTNYVLLGLIIEAATGSTWRQQVRERLLEPLELTASSLPTDDWSDVGPGHIVLSDGTLYEPTTPNELRDFFHPTTLDAAGVLVADVADLARWGAALWGSDQVLAAATRSQQLDETVPIGLGYAYGLGAVRVQDAWGEQIFHNGAVTGYVAWVGYRPTERRTLAVLSNAWTMESGSSTPDWNTEAVDSLWSAWLSE